SISDVNGCIRQINQTVSVTVVGAPVIPSFPVLHVCDDNNDGIGCFDLTSTIAAITGGNPNLTLTFHETADDAQNQVNPIVGTTYCNPNPATQTIYVSLINTGAPDCASTAPLQLFVDPVPVAPATIDAYELCDYTLTGDAQEQFDLSTMDAIVANGQTGLAITYYATEQDAIDETNPIGPLYTSGNATVWVRLEYATGCYAVTSFGLIVNPLPDITPYGPVTLCSDGVSNTASFPIAEYSPYISGGVPGTAVSYHLTQQDADDDVNPLESPYVTDDTVIYVRLENVDTDCATTTTLTLQVEEGPSINTSPTPLERCDPNNDGFEVFDLNLATADILGGIVPGLTVSYHETPDDAQNNVNPITDPYTNIQQWGQPIYVRVTSDATGCPSFATLNLIVKPTPEANEDADPLQECDPDGDGQAFFDLASSIPNILNGLDATIHTVRFWPTEADYLAGSNEIVGIDAYLSTSTTIYVSVDSSVTQCADLVELELIVNPLPVVPFPVDTITTCDSVTPDDQTEVFDLTMRIPAIVGSQTGMEVTFYRNEADALGHANPIDTPEAYANEVPAVQTIWITVTNVATACESVTTMDIRVEPLPSPILPALDDPRINLCDGNQDGIAEFDLDALIADMQQGDTNITITFHPTQDDADNGVNALSSPYTNDDAFVDTVWVRAVNATTLCERVLPITLNVTPAPVIPAVTPGPLEVCDTLGNTQDGFALFDLTAYEADILAAQTGTGTYTIEYYTSLAAAQDGLLPIINPAQYQGTSGEIWYRIEGSVNDCSNIGSFLIQVNAPLALPVSIGQWSQCDTDPVGPAIATEPFDLTSLPASIAVNFPAVPAGSVVTYYANQSDYLGGTNAIAAADLSAYVNVANAQTIYIEVTNAEGCTSHTTLTLKVLPLPTIVSLTADQDLHICDTDATVGTEEFDLTQNEEYIANNDPNLAFSYYLSLSDAETATSPIADPAHHTSATGSVWVRIEKLPTLDVEGEHCYVIVEMHLFVDELPQVATPTDALPGCAAAGSTTAVFDLTQANAAILVAPQVPANFTFAYYTDATDAANGLNPIADPTAFTGTDGQQVYVVVSNIASDCNSTVVAITLDVQEAAVATQPTAPGTQCADPANGTTHVFDLTAFDAEILGTQDPVQFTIAYYANLADAQANANAIADPANFDTATTIVYAVVTNSLSAAPCRSDIIAIDLTVEPLLQVAIAGEDILCVTYPDLTPIAPGTLLEITGIPDPTQYVYEWYLGGVALGVNAPQYYAQAPGVYTADVVSISQGCLSQTASHTLIL
ncbi:hypothetical protein G6047_00440, partial [Flavobacterium sp. SE-s28]|nr:hypothetical protein [Flavobacterium silvaticum]